MKTISKILFYGILCLSVFFSSCVNDHQDDLQSEDDKVTILFSTDAAAGSRALTEEDTEADKAINSFRVMIFKTSDGKLSPVRTFTTPLDNPEKIELYTGTYDFVFIANEHSDATLSAKLNAVTNIGELKAISIGSGAFSPTKDIPSVTVFENVKVSGQNKVVVPAQRGNDSELRIDGGVWPVRLERAGVRADIEIKLSETQTYTGSLTVGNVPNKVWLWPGKYNDGTYEASDRTFTPVATDGGKTLTWKRIILPESMFEDTDDESKGVVIGLTVNGVKSEATIGCDVTLNPSDPDYTLPRNTYVGVEGTVKDDGLTLFIAAENWDLVDTDGDVQGRKLNVSETEAAILYRTVATAEAYNIYFWSNQKSVYVEKTGYRGDDMGNEDSSLEFNVNDIFDLVSGDTNGDGSEIGNADNFSYTYSNGLGTGCITLKPKNASGVHIGRIVLNAGGMRKEILTTTVCYDGTPTAPSICSYVGAFWRASETGERLIRIPAANSTQTLGAGDKGKWMAVVGEENNGREWIVLDTMASGDAGVWGASFSAVVEGNSAYQVRDGGKLDASGTATDSDPIYFRIGLKSKLEGGNPAAAPRYGVVYLLYNNYTKVHKIYIRQGEAPDYVMAPGDPGMPDAPTRPDAKPWSPFNLTAKTWSSNDAEFVQIKKRDWDGGGYIDGTGDSEPDFAAYPTMAGAMFQWAQNTDATGQLWQRRAFNPGLTTYAPASWNNTSYSSWTWDDELHETCPEGYRRSDIKIQGDGIAGNEAWQSFISIHQASTSGNSAWGYYADGYFDRLQVEMAEGGGANTTNASVVAKGGKDAAYIGRIIFNNCQSSDHYNASLFVPAAGFRTYTSGALTNAGSYGNNWSRLVSSANSDFGCMLYVTSSSLVTNAYNVNKAGGFSMRCVYDPTSEPEYIAPRFAKSNIVLYIDGDGNRILTFAERIADFTSKTVNYVNKVNDGAESVIFTGPTALKANVQGLHFRWGGLVGLSSTCGADVSTAFNGSNDIQFWPAEYEATCKANNGGKTPDQVTWKYNDTPGEWQDAAQVPYLGDQTITTTTNTYDAFEDYFDADYFSAKGESTTVGYDAKAGYGDICRYMSDKGWVEGNWRMPTFRELELLYSETTAIGTIDNGLGNMQYGVMYGTYASGISWKFLAMTNPDATYTDYYGFTPVANARMIGGGITAADRENQDYLTKGGKARVVLPGAGRRHDTNGYQNNTGYYGYYWGSTPGSATNGSYLYVHGSGINKVTLFSRSYGYSIRCIRAD